MMTADNEAEKKSNKQLIFIVYYVACGKKIRYLLE